MQKVREPFEVSDPPWHSQRLYFEIAEYDSVVAFIVELYQSLHSGEIASILVDATDMLEAGWTMSDLQEYPYESEILLRVESRPNLVSDLNDLSLSFFDFSTVRNAVQHVVRSMLDEESHQEAVQKHIDEAAQRKGCHIPLDARRKGRRRAIAKQRKFSRKQEKHLARLIRAEPGKLNHAKLARELTEWSEQNNPKNAREFTAGECQTKYDNMCQRDHRLKLDYRRTHTRS